MIKEYRRISNGHNSEVVLEVETTDIWNCNALHVEAGTNGYHGGDHGHGGASFFSIEDIAASDFNFGEIKTPSGTITGLCVEFFGDSELDTFIEALDFIAETLRRQRGPKKDEEEPC